MPRVLKTKLDLGSGDDKHINETAKSVGIAPNTLRSLLRDDWDQLARGTIERVCDRFNLEIHELFRLEPSDFWTSFAGAQFPILRGVKREGGSKVPLEEASKTELTHFLKANFPNDKIGYVDLKKDPKTIVTFVKKNGGIVIGSNPSNYYAEYLVSQHFGAKPYDSDFANRNKIPFRFIHPARGDESTLLEPDPKGNRYGIWARDQRQLLGRSWVPPERYINSVDREGRDYGFVLVVNSPFESKKRVKMIVLLGLTEIGTKAATKALLRDFRDLEPAGDERQVIGIVEARYQKLTPNTDARDLKGYRWIYLSGGRKRILLASPEELSKKTKWISI